jgi:CRISPR-associated endonuclease/helicase Cas3
LQTGDEYRERIGLKSGELAVLIGSLAIKELHEKAKKEEKSETPVDDSSFQIKMIYLKKRIEKIKKGIKNEKR